MIAFVLIEEAGYNLYTGAITIACISGWFVQVGLSAGSIKCRFRIDTHLIYYAGLQLIQGLGFLLVTLVVAEIVNQSLLQNEPLMPGLSTMIGYPEMSREVSENLTESQRMELRWAPLRLELLWFLILLPLQLLRHVCFHLPQLLGGGGVGVLQIGGGRHPRACPGNVVCE